MKTRAAIILAAGFGSRLDADEGHKLLATVGSQPLLAHHLQNFARLGITKVIVVTGYKAQTLTDAVEKFETPAGLEVHCAYNQHFDGQNGLSVLAGVDALHERGQTGPFWLTMSDHLFDPNLFTELSRRFDKERPPAWQGVLGVDYKLDTIFDMPDATKVRSNGDDFAIGKELTDFDTIDVGLFWCDQGFVNALKEERERRGDCSTSDAVRRLYSEGRFGFWDVGDVFWQDVDTPQARRHAERLWAAQTIVTAEAS